MTGQATEFSTSNAPKKSEFWQSGVMAAEKPIRNWFSETFSSDADADDIVKSRSLNITRIAGVLVPILAGIATAIAEVADKPPFNDSAFQKQLVLALVLLIAVVTVADIIGRSIANLGDSLARRNDSVVGFVKSIVTDDALENLGMSINKVGSSLAKLGDSVAETRVGEVATPLPRSFAARHVKSGADVDGYVVAFRGRNASDPTGAGEYLFVAKDDAQLPAWLPVDVLDLT